MRGDPYRPPLRPSLDLDRDAARSLATTMRSHGFDAEHLDALVEVPRTANAAGGRALIAYRCDEAGPLGTLARLFALSSSVPLEAAAAALHPHALADLVTAGLLEVHDSKAYATIQIQGFGPYLFATDLSSWYGDPAFVLQFSRSAHRIASAALFPSSGRVLDLCCGAGMLGVIAADLGAEVVATDLNPRTAMFTRLNAALNGVEIDARVGDGFDPVAGERFDLIVANPPFIISPDTSRMFLTAQQPVDGFCRSIAAGAEAHLTATGFCQFLAAWPVVEGEDPDARVGAWFDGFGGDVWVMEHERIGALDYAASFLDNRLDHPGDLGAWVAYYWEQRIEAIVHGLVTMQRSATTRMRAHTTEPVEHDTPFRDHLASVFAACCRVAAGGRDTLLDAVLVPGDAVSVVYETPLPPGAPRIEVRKRSGIHYVIEANPVVAELLGACDGQRSVRDVASLLAAARGVAVESLIDGVATVAEESLATGVLRAP